MDRLCPWPSAWMDKVLSPWWVSRLGHLTLNHVAGIFCTELQNFHSHKAWLANNDPDFWFFGPKCVRQNGFLQHPRASFSWYCIWAGCPRAAYNRHYFFLGVELTIGPMVQIPSSMYNKISVHQTGSHVSSGGRGKLFGSSVLSIPSPSSFIWKALIK